VIYVVFKRLKYTVYGNIEDKHLPCVCSWWSCKRKTKLLLTSGSGIILS